MNDPKQALKVLYRALTDHALDPDVPQDREFYEPYVENLADGDPVEELLTDIDFAESESLHLVSGQRGTGKSTELKRLRNLLRDAGYVVFYVDMLDYIAAAEPVEISDFLLTVTAALAEQGKQQGYGEQLQESYWERIHQLLTAEVELGPLKTSLKGGALAADIQARLKLDPSFKKQLQQATRGHIVPLMKNVQDFIIGLVKSIREKNTPQQRVAFIVDSFEQIRGNANNADEVHAAMADMFSRHGDKLHLPQLHFVITVPPYLTTAAPGVTRITQSNPISSLPTLHVRDRHNKVDGETLKIMRKMVYRRSPEAKQIFSREGLDRLAEISGGDLRNFFSMLRTAVRKAATRVPCELPIAGEMIEQAEEALRRDFLPITDEDVRWLHRVHDSKRAELPDMKSLPLLARLFDATLIINYRNGDDWYGIHPLVLAYVEERWKTLEQRGTAKNSA